MNKIRSFIFNKKFISGYLLGLISTPVAIALVVALSLAYDMSHWDEVEIPVLGKGKASLVFERKHAHPFLAEYDRRFGVKIGSKKVRMHTPAMNTGGRTKINFFKYEFHDGTWIKARDRFGEYVFNMNTGEALNLVKVDGTPFVGDLNDQGMHSTYFDNDISTLTVLFGEHEAEEDNRFLNDGVYAGTLRGLNYFTAENKPHERIETMREHFNKMRQNEKLIGIGLPIAEEPSLIPVRTDRVYGDSAVTDGVSSKAD